VTSSSIAGLFAAAVARHPAREALVWREQRWTYQQLGARAAAGARICATLTSRERPYVAFVAGNSAAYVVAYFGALLAGATTVEIGRGEEKGTIARLLDRVRPALVLTDRDDLEGIVGDAPTLSLDTFLEQCGTEAGAPVPPPGTDAPASVVFTSGTTGLPKGVVLSHRNILFVIEAVCRYLGMTEDDRYGLILPLAHTYGKSNLLSAIAAGASVVLIEESGSAPLLLGRLAKEGCTIASVVPFHLNMLARSSNLAETVPSALRAVTTSGGALPVWTTEALAQGWPRVAIFSMYGLTESSTRATFLPHDELTAKPKSVGRVLPGMTIEIRDAEGHAVPAGAEGAIWLHGPNVMQGYWEDPDATGAVLEKGWLNTGDVGYLDDTGCLFITGRAKDIVKVAGERISLAEIESVVATHPDVADAAAVGMPHPFLGEVVWVYVVPGAAFDPVALGAFCAERLSHHKVPRRFVRSDRIPRTATGKIQRHLLDRGAPRE
jgi:long-chain acyl-CoA synthetase